MPTNWHGRWRDMSLTSSLLVLIGVAAAPYMIDAVAPGFQGSKRELTRIVLVRIFFPGAGLLVMSAWCLGVLNSHHRFFASYTAPVAWNLAIIGFLLLLCGPHHSQTRLAVLTAWGAVVGAALRKSGCRCRKQFAWRAAYESISPARSNPSKQCSTTSFRS